jgi:hypothetical protein
MPRTKYDIRKSPDFKIGFLEAVIWRANRTLKNANPDDVQVMRVKIQSVRECLEDAIKKFNIKMD